MPFLFFFLYLCPLVGPSCIPLYTCKAPLGAHLMDIFAFTHKKKSESLSSIKFFISIAKFKSVKVYLA